MTPTMNYDSLTISPDIQPAQSTSSSSSSSGKPSSSILKVNSYSPKNQHLKDEDSDPHQVEDEDIGDGLVQESHLVEQHLRSLALREQSRRRAVRQASSFILLPNSPVSFEPITRVLGFSSNASKKPSSIRTLTALRTLSNSHQLSPLSASPPLRPSASMSPTSPIFGANQKLLSSSTPTFPVPPDEPNENLENPALQDTDCPSALSLVTAPKGLLTVSTDELTQTDRTARAERVQSVFIEHCEWTASPTTSSSSAATPRLPTHPEEAPVNSAFEHHSGITLEPFEPALIPPRRPSLIQYLSGLSVETLSAWTGSPPLAAGALKAEPVPVKRMSTSRHHLLQHSDSFEDGEKDDAQYPVKRLLDRKIGVLDWILCGCWISDAELEAEQEGRTGPE